MPRVAHRSNHRRKSDRWKIGRFKILESQPFCCSKACHVIIRSHIKNQVLISIKKCHQWGHISHIWQLKANKNNFDKLRDCIISGPVTAVPVTQAVPRNTRLPRWWFPDAPWDWNIYLHMFYMYGIYKLIFHTWSIWCLEKEYFFSIPLVHFGRIFRKQFVPKQASIVRCAPQETYLAPEKSASQMKSNYSTFTSTMFEGLY